MKIRSNNSIVTLIKFQFRPGKAACAKKRLELPHTTSFKYFIMKFFILPLSLFFLSVAASGQSIAKVYFNEGDSTTNYYLAIPPTSGNIKAALVLLCPYRNPESILPETMLHNVAAFNDILTVYASVGNHFIPDDSAIQNINKLMANVVSKYHADTSAFVLAGFDVAGLTALKYTELSNQQPEQFIVQPKIVFGIASPVDLTGLYNLCQRQITKNYFPPAVGDAKFITGILNKNIGTPNNHAEQYTQLSPFTYSVRTPGNEQYLKHTAVRLYYDADIDWQLKARRNSYYDTYMPDASELINRLLSEGNMKAEFISSKQPGVRSNGYRNAASLSIVDAIDCIQWIKKELHVFSPGNPMAFNAPYTFGIPNGWHIERTLFPPPFAPDIKLKGIEEIRFPPGWGVAASHEYWSMAYLFWLNKNQAINADVLKEMLTTYFDGLVITGGGAVPHNIPKDKLIPTKVSIQKKQPEADDIETYSGTINMLDYMAMKPMTLNFMIHVKSCDDKNHFPVFAEASLKPFSDPLWNDLKSMKQHFVCGE